MIRLLGAITGSALALAALLVLIGVPQFKVATPDVERNVVTLPLRAEPVDDTSPQDVDEQDTGEQPVATRPPAAPAVIAPATGADSNIAAGNVVAAADVIAADDRPTSTGTGMMPETGPEPVQPQALEPDSLQWYAFWSPFRSEMAAAGFVSQLQRVTGLDYRVVKIKAGVYEVAFAYADDAELSASLSQIAAATGLEMAGN